MSENMSYASVLYEMQEIKDEWRRNDYTYLEGQKERYALLLEVRRVRVAQMYADGRVHDGSMQSG
tara:strand:+ start:195 stop:389 length:195 start_codon:yes stop_codon:yes gene_type:complete